MKVEDFLQGGEFSVEEPQGQSVDAFLGGDKSFDLDQSQAALASSQSRLDSLRYEAQAAEQAAQQATAPATIAKETARGAAGSIFDPFIKAGRTAVQAVGEAFGAKNPVEEYQGISGPQQTLQKDVAEGKSVPRAMGEFALEAGSVIPIGKAASLTKKPVAKGAELLGKAVTSTTEKTGLSAFFEKRAANKAIKFSQELTSRKVTKDVAEAAISRGNFRGPGIFRAAKITPTPYDNEVAESVANLVKRGPVKKNVDSINQEIARISQGVRGMVADRKVPFNEAQLRTKLLANKENNKIVFASDATAERVYDAVVDEFVKHAKKLDTEGLLDARQSFDKVPAIKKLLQSEKLGENVRRQVVLDVRDAANRYIADLLPPNNPYRALMLKETKMFEAMGNIAEKNAGILGKNEVQLLTDKYPILKWVVGGTVAGTITGGVGAGGAIIGSTDR